MDIVIFEPHHLRAGLGALMALTRTPSQRHQRVVEAVAWLHGVVLDARSVGPVSPQAVAAAITGRRRRKRLVQLAVLTAMVDGRVAPTAARAVAELARALAVHEPAVRTLAHLAAGREVLVRLALMRRLFGRLVRKAWRDGSWRAVRQFLGALVGRGADPAVEARYAALAELPRGSLGHALHEHCTKNGLHLPGQAGSIPEFALFHDIGHVLSGYGVDPAGEIRQAAFQAGFVRGDGFAFLFFGIVQFHLGVRLTPVAAAERGYFDVEGVFTALARGARCAADLSEGWSFWDNAWRPVTQLRAQLGVPARALVSRAA